MARMFFAINTAEIACVAATAKTILQIVSASNRRTVASRIGIFFDGISPTAEPVQVEFRRQTTAIGGTPTSVTPAKTKPYADSLQITAFTYGTSPTEPTQSDILDVFEIHPQSGVEVILTEETGDVEMDGATRLGIVVTAPANVNCRVKINGEE